MRVDWTHDPPVVQEILAAANTVMRSEGAKTKQLASNIDLAIVVVSGHPLFSADLLLRVLASLKAAQIPVVIAVNKADQAAGLEKAREALRLSLPALKPPHGDTQPDKVLLTCCEISATTGEGMSGLASLLKLIERFFVDDADTTQSRASGTGSDKQTSIALIGQSGMGKSSLLNRLVPQAAAQTQEISEALQTGRHTTTVSKAYHWPDAPTASCGTTTWVIDTPGFQRFGLAHLSLNEIGACFPEWALLQRETSCRFYNCRHSHEPGCGVKAGIAAILEKNPSLGTHLESRRRAWLALIT